jgi:hypothetical protein
MWAPLDGPPTGSNLEHDCKHRTPLRRARRHWTRAPRLALQFHEAPAATALLWTEASYEESPIILVAAPRPTRPTRPTRQVHGSKPDRPHALRSQRLAPNCLRILIAEHNSGASLQTSNNVLYRANRGGVHR